MEELLRILSITLVILGVIFVIIATMDLDLTRFFYRNSKNQLKNKAATTHVENDEVVLEELLQKLKLKYPEITTEGGPVNPFLARFEDYEILAFVKKRTRNS